MRRLTILFFLAFFFPALPAGAASLAVRDFGAPASRAVGAGFEDTNPCSLPQLSSQADSNPSPIKIERNDATFDSQDADDDNRWVSGAGYRSNADLNHAIDHLIEPPDRVRLYATQTGEDLPGGFEGTNNPNATVGAIELVIR